MVGRWFKGQYLAMARWKHEEQKAAEYLSKATIIKNNCIQVIKATRQNLHQTDKMFAEIFQHYKASKKLRPRKVALHFKWLWFLLLFVSILFSRLFGFCLVCTNMQSAHKFTHTHTPANQNTVLATMTLVN